MHARYVHKQKRIKAQLIKVGKKLTKRKVGIKCVQVMINMLVLLLQQDGISQLEIDVSTKP